MASYGSVPAANGKSHGNGNGDAETTPLISQSEKEAAKVMERSLWSRLIFSWFTPILHKGNEKKKLDQEDLALIPLPPDCSTENVSNEFDKYWSAEMKLENPSLLRALFRAFGAEFVRAGFLKLVHDLSIFVGPQVLHAIIVFLRNPNAPLWHGLALTAAVTISQLTMSFCLRHYFFKLYGTGLRVRTAIVVAVYRKALVLSSGERQTRTLGEITNLMSIDAQRLQGTCSQWNSCYCCWSIIKTDKDSLFNRPWQVKGSIERRCPI
jgi:ATP-binding cassette subfamily C (CFTR/MRP) protein 1